METRNDFILINTTFSPSETREMLSHIIESKINFHAIRNLSSQERYGHPDEHSIERMKHLRATWETLKEMIDQAKREDKELSIFSGLHVEMVEKKDAFKTKELADRY